MKDNILPRFWAILACLALIAGTILFASPAEAANKKVQVWTNGFTLNVRETPSSSAKVVGKLKDRKIVTITCYKNGSTVNGQGGKTKIWDKLSTGGYVSDGWLKTGSNKPVVPACSTAKPKPKPKADPGYRLPFPKGKTYTITQGPKEHAAGYYPKYNKHAVDFAMKKGSTVSASQSGKVYLAKAVKSGGGNMVLIDHGSNKCTQYAHLNTIKVKKGQKVKRGQTIGTSGDSGVAYGAHLHWNMVNCKTETSLEIVNTKELGKTYKKNVRAKSKNG
jgi:murein DD-endopeptidase MepM/ murein hydrolase activator NlpD